MVRVSLAVAVLALAACGTRETKESAATEEAAKPEKEQTVATQATAANQAPSPDDPYIWLEAVEDERALSFVRERNAETVKALAQDPRFESLKKRIRANLDSDARIPFVYKMGEHYYNFWRDANNERGLWRRTSLAEYRKPAPKWDVLLDLDALGKQEGENWVWAGADCLRPDYRHCLISLSRGGADASVTREFDLVTRKFVANGFQIPEAKGSLAWISKNEVFVSTDFGEGSMTKSGYPRIVKRWRRGTPLGEAIQVFEGKLDDVWVAASYDDTPGYEREVLLSAPTFWTNEAYLVRGKDRIRFDKPMDANLSWHRQWLMLELRSDWKLGEKTWPAGALLVTRFEDFIAGKRDFEMLFEPGARKALGGFSTTRNHILINELEDVRNRIYVATFDGTQWTRQPLSGVPQFGNVQVSGVDNEDSDAYWLTSTDYLTPTTVSIGEINKAAPEPLKQLPAFFKADGLKVDQHFASSLDGTRVPYFIVHRADLKLDGSHPTLLYGYGGFEVPLLPGYSGSVGSAWLEQGGVYVVGNIRGGGEYGPAWHQAALKANRHKAYEDFAAVARDLIARKITSPKHLGVQGGSNGGLLTGNMLTQYPDLFGAVVIQVPLLDMRRYHTLLAGASWMGEYGDPDKADEWSFIQGFSPYHNVKADQKYPPVLLTTSTRDDRVHPGHARKMTALMRAQGHPEVYYYENIEGGHGGAANNEQAAFMQALAYTFLWQKLAD